MTSRVVTVMYIRATPEALWKALITPDIIRRYWNGAFHESSWELGAPWTLRIPDGRVADTGEVLEFEEPRRLSVSWRSELRTDLRAEGYARCLWTLEPDAGDVVKLTVTHEMDGPDSVLIAMAANSWPAILGGLKTLLETGVPLDMTHHWPSKALRAEQA